MQFIFSFYHLSLFPIQVLTLTYDVTHQLTVTLFKQTWFQMGQTEWQKDRWALVVWFRICFNWAEHILKLYHSRLKVTYIRTSLPHNYSHHYYCCFDNRKCQLLKVETLEVQGRVDPTSGELVTCRIACIKPKGKWQMVVSFLKWLI